MTDGLRKSHLRKAPQVGLSEVGLPDIYLSCNEVDVQLSMEVDADVEQSFGACCRLAATAPIQNGSCDISFVTLLHSTVATPATSSHWQASEAKL